MDRIRTFDEYIESFKKNEIIDYDNPKCIKCNDCCTLGASLTIKEYKDLKKYFATDINGKILYANAKKLLIDHLEEGTLYMNCPFSSQETKRCKIYNRRPKVCKQFHCKSELNKLVDIKEDGAYEYTLMHLFFDLPTYSECE
ncbi:MAG: YkgJ family cysteine cluster protein [Paraclostridium sp.]